MSFRAVYIGIAGALMLAIGLYLMSLPVYLDDFDQFGMQIPCGSGFGAHLVQANAAGQEYADKCGSAVMTRQLWTIPVVALGALALIAVLFRAATSLGARDIAAEPRYALTPWWSCRGGHAAAELVGGRMYVRIMAGGCGQEAVAASARRLRRVRRLRLRRADPR